MNKLGEIVMKIKYCRLREIQFKKKNEKLLLIVWCLFQKNDDDFARVGKKKKINHQTIHQDTLH